MKYMGSKNRIAKFIIPIIQKNRMSEQYYIEPFVGGANMIDKIEGKRFGSDSNEYLIEMWKALQKGWIPRKNYTREEYDFAKMNKDIDKKLTGWIGICCSYSGKWFGGYAGIVSTKQGVRNYQEEAYNNVMKQINSLKDVYFMHCDYKDLNLPKQNSIIYCDPPYASTTKYQNDFDHTQFWDWCREISKDGHSVFISEYNAPDDFVKVWEKEVNSSLSANGIYGKNKVSTEKLFIYKG